MRYVILMLVAINCAYFGWQLSLNEPIKPVEHSLPPLPQDAGRLATVEENAEGQSLSGIQETEDLTATQPPGAVLPLHCQALGPFLTESGLEVAYKAPEGVSSHIPVAIDPWLRYAPGWSGYEIC